MREILRNKIKEKKEKFESKIYSITSLKLENKKLFCPQNSCNHKPKPNELKLYVDNYVQMYCVKCLNDWMKEEIINGIKWEVIETLYELWKEEEENGKKLSRK